jgi:hypothetical protein
MGQSRCGRTARGCLGCGGQIRNRDLGGAKDCNDVINVGKFMTMPYDHRNIGTAHQARIEMSVGPTYSVIGGFRRAEKVSSAIHRLVALLAMLTAHTVAANSSAGKCQLATYICQSRARQTRRFRVGLWLCMWRSHHPRLSHESRDEPSYGLKDEGLTSCLTANPVKYIPSSSPFPFGS